MLEVKNLAVCYGKVQALRNVSITVRRGELVALIGPNGAGKSTLLKAICGLLEEYNGRITEGDIIFKGRSIKKLKPYELARLGIGIVPQHGGIFPYMTVYENLEMGGFLIKERAELLKRIEEVFKLFPVLPKKKSQRASTLSGGEQRMLAIGKTLILKPELLLLDEPSAGLSPNYIEELFKKIKKINEQGTAILLVEQNARLALEYAKRVYIFSVGQIVKEGQADALIRDREIKEIYLGQTKE